MDSRRALMVEAWLHCEASTMTDRRFTDFKFNLHNFMVWKTRPFGDTGCVMMAIIRNILSL
jgi:hypothetical protein